MSCYSTCGLPCSILPKSYCREVPPTCREHRCSRKCNTVQIARINKGRRGLCVRPPLADLIKCSVCQEARMERILDDRASGKNCWLQNHVKNIPEIPFIWTPERQGIKFMRYGYTREDCIPQDVLDNPCKHRAAYRKKTKQWIKDLSDHYCKVTTRCAAPVEDYIRLNLSNLCESCPPTTEDDKCPPKVNCQMAHHQCTCPKGH